jgi:hypothetical protein
MIKKVLVMLLLFVMGTVGVQALTVTYVTDLFIDTPTISKGYTVRSNDQNFNLGIYPEVLAMQTRVVVKQYDKDEFDYPEGWTAVSNVYEFDIFNKDAFQDEKPLTIRIKTEETKQLKKMFFYNKVITKWVELPSKTKDLETIDSILHLPYAKMVVLANDDIIEIGDASWYAYKGCACAASPDYAKGTVLEVIDLDTDKQIEVVVNDYGPDRSIHPNRVIDLDKVAFSELGWLGSGILHNILVRVK